MDDKEHKHQKQTNGESCGTVTGESLYCVLLMQILILVFMRKENGYKESLESYRIPRCNELYLSGRGILCASPADPDEPYTEMEEPDENI